MTKKLLSIIIALSCRFSFAGNCDSLLMDWSQKKDLSFTVRKSNLVSIIKKAQSAKDKHSIANCYRRLGTLFKNNGQLDSAIHAYVTAARFAESAYDTLSLASSLNQVGVTYKELKNNTQALAYFKKAFYNYSLIPHYRGMADAGINMADIEFDLNHIQESEKLCLESRANMLQWGDTSTLGYNYDLLAIIRLKNGQAKQSLTYLKSACLLFQKDEDLQGQLPALIHTGDAYLALKNNDSALYYFKQGYELAVANRYKKWIAESALAIAQLYESRRMADSAIFYIRQHVLYSDSLLNENITQATANALTRYDTEKKEMELDHQQQLNLILAVLSILLLFTIIVLVRYFSQRKKTGLKESELQNANAMLHGQDVERERIARELHDRIGSMLSTVKLHFSSMEEHVGELIKVQGKSYGKAIELLDETYEEVRRISHDLDTGLLSRFGFRTAMLQLVQVIESTNMLKILYLDNGLNPTLYQPFETDLYRITQELLSNTIKYAGAKEISIQLSRNNGNLIYSYEDDGAGFSKEVLQQAHGIGYKNIDSRVKKMKGSWHLDTSPGHGINLIIELPLDANQDHNS